MAGCARALSRSISFSVASLYRLTPAGEDFRSIVELMSVWGQRWDRGPGNCCAAIGIRGPGPLRLKDSPPHPALAPQIRVRNTLDSRHDSDRPDHLRLVLTTDMRRRRCAFRSGEEAGGVGSSVEVTMRLAIEDKLCAAAHDGDPGDAVDPTADAMKC